MQPRSSGQNRPPAARRAAAPKLSWKDARELESIEARIAALEQAKAALLVKMNDVGDDYLRLQSLAEQLETTEHDLDAILDRWLELSELREG